MQGAHHLFDVAPHVALGDFGRLAAPAENEQADAFLLLDEGFFQRTVPLTHVGRLDAGGFGAQSVSGESFRYGRHGGCTALGFAERGFAAAG